MKTTDEKRQLYKSAEARTRLLSAYEEALGRWRESTGLELERLRIATDWGETAVFAFGPSGAGGACSEPLVLIHGTLSNSAAWMGDAAALARGRRAYAIDVPGEPGLSEERPLPWEPRAASAWLGQVVRGLGLGEHSIVGLSMGGWIGLARAIERPADLRSLAMLAPAGIGAARPSFLFKAILSAFRGPAGRDGLCRSLFGDEDPPEGALEVSRLFADSTNPRSESLRSYRDDELAGISARLFLLVGGKDVMIRSKESVRRLSRLKPEATIRILPGAGHAIIGKGGTVADFLERRG